jgi:hypothetical protein
MRRCALRIVALLTLGAIVNIAVAWGCGFIRHTGCQPKLRTEGNDLLWWRANAPTGFDLEEMFDRFTGFGHEYAQWPLRHVAPFSRFVVGRARSGWPVLSMEYSLWEDAEPNRVVSRYAWLLQRNGRALGSRPLWPGFVINTVFYAVLLWLLFAAPFALRRRRRIKRSLCPACAYPVGASDVCTECGKPVTPKEITS